MTQQPHISDFKLEELALGTLPKAETKALREALEHDREAMARFEAIEKSSEALLRELTPNEVDAEVRRRIAILESASKTAHPKIKTTSAASPRLAWSALTVSVCAAALLFMFFPSEEPPPGYRLKGEPYLVVHRVVKKGVEQLADGDPVREGDRIQLSVVPAGRRHVAVFSVDGRGHVTLHFPQEDGDGKLEDSSTPFSLPRSYELDDAPVFERFFLITSQAPLDMTTVMKNVRQYLARLNSVESAALDGLLKDTAQSSFLLKKVRQVR